MKFRQPFTGEYPITQYYGESVTSAFHTGIDYGCPIGVPILASADGIIRYNGFDKTGYGNCIIIEHDISHATLYGHLNNTVLTLSPGIKVKQGDLIGWSGSTGNSTGPHLHFEARREWNNYRTHFNPIDLPLISVDDSINNETVVQLSENNASGSLNELKFIDPIPGPVCVIAPSGVFMHNESFTAKQAIPFGTKLSFTGKTKEINGLTFCECTVWIAANDGNTQILLSEN